MREAGLRREKGSLGRVGEGRCGEAYILAQVSWEQVGFASQWPRIGSFENSKRRGN